MCRRSRGQYFISSIRFGSFFLFLRVVYVRCLHSVHASWIVGRFSTLAMASLLGDLGDSPGADRHLEKPVTLASLLDAMGELLDGADEGAAAQAG